MSITFSDKLIKQIKTEQAVGIAIWSDQLQS